MTKEPSVTQQEQPRTAVDHTGRDAAAETPGTTLFEILLETLLFLASKKRLILGTAVAGTLAAAVIALGIPNSYRATAVIMPPQQQQSTAAAMLSQLGPLAGSAGGVLGLKTSGDLYVGLLGSRTIADHIIDRFRLREVYGEGTVTSARKKLERNRRFTSDLKSSLIRIEVDDLDPARAAAIANAFVEELNQQNSFFAATAAGERRQFLKTRIEEEKTALATAEDAMKSSQMQGGVVQVDAQAQLAMMAVAQLRAQITSVEVALQRLKMGATPDNPEVVRSEAELSALRLELRRRQDSPRSGSSDPLLSTAKLPESVLEYLRRLREVKYHEYLFEMLSKQYEAARIDEIRAAPAIQVVDPAVPPERKNEPNRTVIVLSGGCGALAVGIVLAYLLTVLSGPRHRANLRLLKAQFSRGASES